MIGKVIETANNAYTITEPISVDRDNANIYLCIDSSGNKFAIKHFYDQSPKANIGLNVYNHFGRRRDGSETVFNEIREKNIEYEFLLKHIERVHIDGKWLIIVEYAPGITLTEFIHNFHVSNIKKVEYAIIKLAEMLTVWHDNGFAHGDPHLDNVMVNECENNTCQIKLIDYCLIHHKDFHWCQEFHCFDSDPNLRTKEDLQNNSKKLGQGFRKGIIETQEELNLGTILSDIFDLHYRHSSPNT